MDKSRKLGDRYSKLTKSASADSIIIPHLTAPPKRSNSWDSEADNSRTSTSGSILKIDTRPIGDKNFQNMAQKKIKNFFSNKKDAAHLLTNGEMKPMNLNRFVGMVNYLVQMIDARIQITTNNYKQQIFFIADSYRYNGKVLNSWLISVSAPCSWRYVLAFILWLVDLCVTSESFDALGALYPADGEANTIFEHKGLVERTLTGYQRIYINAQPEKNNNIMYAEFLEGIRRKCSSVVGESAMDELAQQVLKTEKELQTLENNSAQIEILNVVARRENISQTKEKYNTYQVGAKNYITELKEHNNLIIQDINAQEKEIQKLMRKRDELNNMLDRQEREPPIKKEIAETQTEIRVLKKQKCSHEKTNYDIENRLACLQISMRYDLNTYNSQIMNRAEFNELREALINDESATRVNSTDIFVNYQHVDDVLTKLEKNFQNEQVMDRTTYNEKKKKIQKELNSVKIKFNKVYKEWEDFRVDAPRLLREKKHNFEELKKNIEKIKEDRLQLQSQIEETLSTIESRLNM